MGYAHSSVSSRSEHVFAAVSCTHVYLPSPGSRKRGEIGGLIREKAKSHVRTSGGPTFPFGAIDAAAAGSFRRPQPSARAVVLFKMAMVSRLTVMLVALGARASAFHIPAVSRSVLPSSSNKMIQGSATSCVASRGHRQRSCWQLEAKKKKKSALKGPASDALAQLELLEALEAEMEGVCLSHSLPCVGNSVSVSLHLASPVPPLLALGP